MTCDNYLSLSLFVFLAQTVKSKWNKALLRKQKVLLCYPTTCYFWSFYTNLKSHGCVVLAAWKSGHFINHYKHYKISNLLFFRWQTLGSFQLQLPTSSKPLRKNGRYCQLSSGLLVHKLPIKFSPSGESSIFDWGHISRSCE